MEIRQEIEQELWDMISKNYENESYSSAMLDAIHTLTELIRNRTGLEGDGVSLIGQAFGGDNPRIQLNKLQTDSEKDTQKGIQDILKGIYTGIRNPRSHDKITDSKQDADSIIILVNYLIKVIGKSTISFDESNYLQRVFDQYFVKTQKYADLLVSEIPKRQRCNIAISVLRRRLEGELLNLKIFLNALFEKLEDIDIIRVYRMISDELRFTTSEEEIGSIVFICPPKHWNLLEKSVKIRTENILLMDVREGQYDPITNKFGVKGSLGSLVTREHLLKFEERDAWTAAITSKISSSNKWSRDYADHYFWYSICSTNYSNISFELKHFFKEGLKDKFMPIVDRLAQQIRNDVSHPWWKVFEDELKAFPEIVYEEDELPF